MDIVGLVVCSVCFVMVLKPTYQVWFTPDVFERKLDKRRKSIKILPAIFPKNLALAKLASVFILIVCVIGIVVSIRGPF